MGGGAYSEKKLKNDFSKNAYLINARSKLSKKKSQKCGDSIVIFVKSGWIEGHNSEKNLKK